MSEMNVEQAHLKLKRTEDQAWEARIKLAVAVALELNPQRWCGKKPIAKALKRFHPSERARDSDMEVVMHIVEKLQEIVQFIGMSTVKRNHR